MDDGTAVGGALTGGLMGFGAGLIGPVAGGYRGHTSLAGKGLSSFAMPGLQIAASAYFAYQGYQEGGLTGARDILVADVAVNAAIAKFAHKASHPEMGIGAVRGTIVSRGMLSQAARGAGGAIGSAMGSAVGAGLGIPGGDLIGSIAGAYVGAAPLSFIAQNKMIAAAGIAAGTVAAAGYGAYHVMKMGHAHKQQKRAIQTSGSLAAFMTGGAQTMRARQVQAMHKSHLNARSALGRTAQMYHYPSQNYHSRYRL